MPGIVLNERGTLLPLIQAAAVKEKDDISVAKLDLEAEINQMKVKLAALEKSSSQKKASSTESDVSRPFVDVSRFIRVLENLESHGFR